MTLLEHVSDFQFCTVNYLNGNVKLSNVHKLFFFSPFFSEANIAI